MCKVLQKCVQGVKGGARQNLARDGLGGHVVGGDLPMTGNVMLHIYWRSVALVSVDLAILTHKGSRHERKVQFFF